MVIASSVVSLVSQLALQLYSGNYPALPILLGFLLVAPTLIWLHCRYKCITPNVVVLPFLLLLYPRWWLLLVVDPSFIMVVPQMMVVVTSAIVLGFKLVGPSMIWLHPKWYCL